MLKYIITGLALVSSQVAMADFKAYKTNNTGPLLFAVQSGTEGKQVDVTICLDALAKEKKCQNYSSGITEMGIMPLKYKVDKAYPTAGIKVNSPGYKIEGCKPNKNGYCIFSATSNKYSVLKIKTA